MTGIRPPAPKWRRWTPRGLHKVRGTLGRPSQEGRNRQKGPAYETPALGPTCTQKPQSLSSLFNDPDPDVRVNVGMQTNWNAEDAKRLDRFVEIDLSLLDLDSLRLELMSDVSGRDGAEELSFL